MLKRRSTEDESIEQWRERMLVNAGVAPDLARAVAHDRRYDVHTVIELIHSGCAPATALRIVAP